MSIIDKFGGNGNGKRNGNNNGNRRDAPPLPMPVRTPIPAGAREPHPEALETLSNFSRALDNVDRLTRELEDLRHDSTEEIRQLRADLQLERRTVMKLEEMLTNERRQAENYRRYAVAIRTHLEHLASAALKANDVAMQIADEPVHPDRDAVSREVAEAVGAAALKDELKEELKEQPA